MAKRKVVSPPPENKSWFQPPTPEPLSPRTKTQASLLKALKSNQLVFVIGPAGTGKTYVCAAHAADALRDKTIDKLIITRPAVEAGESLGFLPGELEEKYEPYIAPFRGVFEERLGKSYFEYLLKSKRIEPIPLAYMRGLTFKRAWVILDEAQNTTPTQMKMFLTRIGEDSLVMVNGDLSQKDIRGTSGLEDAVGRLMAKPRISTIIFREEDVVRSDLVRTILKAYADLADGGSLLSGAV